MCKDVLNIHALVDELDEADDSQVVASDINDPPFVLVSEIVQRWEQTPHFIGRTEFTLTEHPIQVFQGLPLVGMSLRCNIERAFRDDVHTVTLLTYWLPYGLVDNVSTFGAGVGCVCAACAPERGQRCSPWPDSVRSLRPRTLRAALHSDYEGCGEFMPMVFL